MSARRVDDALEHGWVGDGVTDDRPALDAPVGVLDLDGDRVRDDHDQPPRTHVGWDHRRTPGATTRGQGDEESDGR